MLCIAGQYHRSRTGVSAPSRAAVLTVMCICWAFILSWLPYLGLWICQFLKISGVPQTYRLFAEHAITINAIINPFIYTATNNTFRVFLADLICRGKLYAVYGSTGQNSVRYLGRDRSDRAQMQDSRRVQATAAVPGGGGSKVQNG